MKLSIRTRLTIFYSLAAFIVLTAICLILYWETINVLYKADYQFLLDEVETSQYILDNGPANLSSLNQEVITAPSKPNSSIYHYFIRIFDDKKNLMIETPGMESILNSDQAINKSTKVLTKPNYRWYTNKHKKYLLIQSPISIGKTKTGVIQIALDMSYQHAVISDRKILFAALIFSTLCSLLIGFFIAQRGLRSLYTLTDTVTQITATSLHQRIDPKSLPKELAALGAAFNQMLDRIENSFIRLKQFSSDLAHELRTPITNLRGQTEIGLSQSRSIVDYQKLLESNLEEFDRISQLLENILFLARAENPQMDLQKTLLNVRQEIMDICEFYQAIAEDKNISLTCEGDAQLFANQIMFRRMLSNILSNALNYTLAGGEIHFKVHEDKFNIVQIEISDNGIGIAKEHLPKLFDRFYRVDSARSKPQGGTGLGLAIVKSIVELHQGIISVASEINKGTTISIAFQR